MFTLQTTHRIIFSIACQNYCKSMIAMSLPVSTTVFPFLVQLKLSQILLDFHHNNHSVTSRLNTDAPYLPLSEDAYLYLFLCTTCFASITIKEYLTSFTELSDLFILQKGLRTGVPIANGSISGSISSRGGPTPTPAIRR